MNKKIIGICISTLLIVAILPTQGTTLKTQDIAIENENNYQIYYTKNIGQFNDNVLFKVHTSTGTVYLCKNEIVTVFSHSTDIENEFEILSIVSSLDRANEDVIVQGEIILPYIHNYYIGNNPDNWYTNVPNYGSVLYKNIYDGIDLRYYSSENSLKYDFIVSPEADPSVIQIRYDGIENLYLTSKGDIQIDTNFGSVIENKPFIYQEVNGVKKEISGKYSLLESNVFGFEIKDYYNPSIPLIIDPTLKYSTYFGGNDYELGREIESDSAGNVYFVGETASTNYPTQNPYQGTIGGITDAFVTKLHPATNTIVYSTYLGGSNFDYGVGIGIDGNGYASITGTTYSSNFPVFAPLFPTLSGTQDAFVARLNPSGGMVYCTYLGGNGWEWGLDINVDSSGNSYVIGYTDSPGFPTFNAYDSTHNGNFDIFISKFDPPGGILLFSTFLGGSNHDIGTGIDFDSSGLAYIIGYTWSTNFPVTGNAYDSSYNGAFDICLAIIDTVTGGPTSLSYGSYVFGTADDAPWDIVIDNSNIMYVTGDTTSTQANFFPITSNAYQQFLQGTRDAFFFQLDTSLAPANQMLYCSYLGGQTGGGGNDAGYSIDLDSNNNAYIAGATECSDFPLVNPLGSYKGGNEAFASLFDTTQSGASSLLDSTYIGGSGDDEGYGISVDNNNDVYVTGLTYSTDFPIQNPYQNTNAGLGDAFITHIGAPVNNPPQQPLTPSGPIKGTVGVSYPYTTSATDPDGDLMRFGWDWNGNGVVDQWDDNGGSWYNSGQLCTTSHSWPAQGTYNIRVMAEDVHGVGSVWSNPLSVTMPRDKALINPFLLRILENLANNFPLLKMILGL
jgi:hypothetical protein